MKEELEYNCNDTLVSLQKKIIGIVIDRTANTNIEMEIKRGNMQCSCCGHDLPATQHNTITIELIPTDINEGFIINDMITYFRRDLSIYFTIVKYEDNTWEFTLDEDISPVETQETKITI